MDDLTSGFLNGNKNVCHDKTRRKAKDVWFFADEK